MRGVVLGASAVLVAALIGAAHAQTSAYPDRPIKVVVPAAAGGVTDTPARIVTNRMRDNLGQSFVVENQGGAGGILASESVKRAPPDGYTLLYVNAATHGLLPALKKSLSYDALKDFVPIAMVVRAPLAIVVRSESPYKTLADLVKEAGSRIKTAELWLARPRQHLAPDRHHARPRQQDADAGRTLSRRSPDDSGSHFRPGGFCRLEHHPHPCRGRHAARAGDHRREALVRIP